MELEISGTLDKIVVGATGREEIIQNVKTILSTVKGSVMLDRTFGLSGEYVDLPGPVLEARLAHEIVEEVERQEPRVEVVEVRWSKATEAGDGKMVPVVLIKIKEGVLDA